MKRLSMVCCGRVQRNEKRVRQNLALIIHAMNLGKANIKWKILAFGQLALLFGIN